ncbi:MAG: FGGY family carbohydrate kinase, partial [Oscillospiraceae bacterium]|nr:FGGY family carbohydrate kinase [Oscillospiraceae bacterium]
SVAAVSLSGYGECVNLVDPSGAPVYPSVRDTDTRAAGLLCEWQASGLAEELRKRCLMAPYAASSGLLVAWLAQSAPDILDRARWCFTVKDYVRFRLTGVAAQEATNASNAGLADPINPERGGELLGLQGIGRYAHLVPPIIQPSDLAGRVTAEAAEATGLKAGTPVAAGCYDVCAAGLACGLSEGGSAAMVLGTWCNNLAIGKGPIKSGEILLSCRYPADGLWLICDGSPTSAGNLGWFVRELMKGGPDGPWASPEEAYAACDAAVGRVGPKDSAITYLPLLYGGYGGRPSKAAFAGLEGWHTSDHVVRAVYEGVCFSHKRHYESIIRHAGTGPGTVRICGGGARSPEWVRMFADAMGAPMEVVESAEPGALGACMCAAVAVGAYPGYVEAMAAMTRVKERVEPDPANAEAYAEKYGSFNELLRAMGVYREPGGLS